MQRAAECSICPTCLAAEPAAALQHLLHQHQEARLIHLARCALSTDSSQAAATSARATQRHRRAGGAC